MTWNPWFLTSDGRGEGFTEAKALGLKFSTLYASWLNSAQTDGKNNKGDVQAMTIFNRMIQNAWRCLKP